MKVFKISISTPTGKKFNSDQVIIVNADIFEGRIGVMAGHTPLVSSLKISKFSIKFKDEEIKEGVVHGGIFNVTKDEVAILTTKFEWLDEIDIIKTQDEINNIKNQMQSDIKEAEASSLNNRLIYEYLKMDVQK